MKIYKCLSGDFNKLQKRINRITKKLDKHNLKWNFEIVGETVETVAIWDYINHDGIPSSQFIPKKLGTKNVKVTNYKFDMEQLKIGDYEVVAIIDHNATVDQKENVIHNFTDITIPKKYRTIDSICEHCNSNRQRNKTILLKDIAGDIKQVGTTCVRDYTGVDTSDVLGIYTDIYDICLEDVEIRYENFGRYEYYADAVEYLANCIEVIEDMGYKKEVTRDLAWEKILEGNCNKKYLDIAKKVIEYFKGKEFNNDFLNNTKIYLSSEYTKCNGIIAYAYIAYKKQLEYDREQEAKTKAKTISEYQFNIKDRKEIELIYIDSYSFYHDIYGTNYIHIFRDAKGNKFTWKTSKNIGHCDNLNEGGLKENDLVRLKGTVKDHVEYRGEKQTQLTRCKVID
jgi:hypothetical protein